MGCKKLNPNCFDCNLAVCEREIVWLARQVNKKYRQCAVLNSHYQTGRESLVKKKKGVTELNFHVIEFP